MGMPDEHLVNNPLDRIRALEIQLSELQRNTPTNIEAIGGVTDHGSLTGLGDDDHTQYSLVAGTRAFTGTVGGVTPVAASDLATKGYVDTVPWTDHGSLSGLGDDDHSQYVHISSARTITAQHTFAPGSPQAPFVLGANAQDQTVVGLDADSVDGYDLNQGVQTTDSPTFAGLTVNGSISVTGLVDGVDVANHDHSGVGEGGTVAHTSLGSVTADQHHTALVGLDGDSGSAVPDGSDVITVSGGTAVTTVAATSTVQVNHGAGDFGDLHTNYAEHDQVETISALWTFTAGIDVDGTLEFQGAESITTTAGNLTLSPAGDLVLDPGGNDVLPGTGYTVDIGAVNKKYLTLHVAELWAQTLVAQDTLATFGGRILVGPTTNLINDAGSGDTTIDVKHNNLASGDRVVMEAGGNVEWMAVTSGPSVISGGYRYNVTRNLDGSGANDWYAGDAVFNTGTVGDGFIDLYSIAGLIPGSTAGPTIVMNVRNSATYSDITEHAAFGNLDGLYGYSATTYGLGLGKYGTSHLTIDPTDGIRFFAGATQTGQWEPGGDLTLGEVATDKANLFWDQSEGELYFRGGTGGTETSLWIDTDGAIQFEIGNSSANRVNWNDSGTVHGYMHVNDTLGTAPYFGLFQTVGSAVASESAYTIVGVLANTINYSARTYWFGTYNDTAASYIGWQLNNTYEMYLYNTGVRISNGLYVGGTGTAPTDNDITLDGDIISGGDTNTYIDLGGTADQMAFYAGGQKMLDLVEGGTDYVDISRGLLFVNETANANMTQGITINQGANDDEMLAGKSSDVTHGCTTVTETNTFWFIQKQGGAAGGLQMTGLTESSIAMQFLQYATIENTAKTTAATAYMTMYPRLISGTGYTNVGANANLFAIRPRVGGANRTVFFVDEDGDVYYDGSLNNYDEENDALAAWDLSHVLAREWDKIIEYGADRLERMGVIGPADERGNRMVSNKRMNALQLGAIGQGYFDRLDLWREVRHLRELFERCELALQRYGLLEV